jgi:hypothetical protein
MEEGGEGQHDAAGNHMHETAYDTEVSAEEAAAAEAPAHGASNSDNANATQTPAAAAWEPPPAPAGPLSGKQKLAHAHEVLSITGGSPDSPTIRKAFRRACLKSHPDKIARFVGTKFGPRASSSAAVQPSRPHSLQPCRPPPSVAPLPTSPPQQP